MNTVAGIACLLAGFYFGWMVAQSNHHPTEPTMLKEARHHLARGCTVELREKSGGELYTFTLCGF